MTHAAEFGHWYDREGKPVWEVPSADGKRMVSPDIRHARKRGLLPGTTSIIRCAAAPGLERWKQEQVLMAALTLSRRHGEPDDRYLDRIIQDAQEQARKAADRGTAIHAEIQEKWMSASAGEHVLGAMTAVERWLGFENFHGADWVREESFSHCHGFGGKADLCAPNYGIVIDFKTKEFGEDDELKTWDEHAMQLAAYREGLDMTPVNPPIKCAIVYVSVTNPGLSRLIQIPEPDLKRGWEMFTNLLSYWQAKNRYNSAFTRELVAA